MSLEPNNIYLGDSYKLIKAIPDKSIDLIVTDPPYDLDTEGSKENRISQSFKSCNTMLKSIQEGINLEILDEYMRVMKKPKNLNYHFGIFKKPIDKCQQ